MEPCISTWLLCALELLFKVNSDKQMLNTSNTTEQKMYMVSMFNVPAFFKPILKYQILYIFKQFLVTIICWLPKHMLTLLGSVQIKFLDNKVR